MADTVSLFELGPGRYQPDSSHTYSYNPGYTLDQRRLAFYVGVIALILPIVMLFGRKFGTCDYDSISHFYYAQYLGGIFVAALVFIGTFLLAYRGESARESTLATLAGYFALFVAFFPTSGRGCEKDKFSGRALVDFTNGGTDAFVTVVKTEGKISVQDNPIFELFSYADIIHGLSAAGLFAFLAWYSFFVFTRVIAKVHLDNEGKLTPRKWYRNILYRGSGVVIVLSMSAIVIGHYFYPDDWNSNNLTFWFEAVALWAFGISWMIKGQWFIAAWID